MAAARGLRPGARRPGRVPAAHGALAGARPLAGGPGPRPRAAAASSPRTPRARSRTAPRPDLRAAAADTPDGVVLRSAERARLRVALGTLPPEQRRAVALAYVGGLTAEEIAAHDGIPLGTVKSRVRLGLHKLRDALPAAGEPAASPSPPERRRRGG